jgi:hypothetical protein
MIYLMMCGWKFFCYFFIGILSFVRTVILTIPDAPQTLMCGKIAGSRGMCVHVLTMWRSQALSQGREEEMDTLPLSFLLNRLYLKTILDLKKN